MVIIILLVFGALVMLLGNYASSTPLVIGEWDISAFAGLIHLAGLIIVIGVLLYAIAKIIDEMGLIVGGIMLVIILIVAIFAGQQFGLIDINEFLGDPPPPTITSSGGTVATSPPANGLPTTAPGAPPPPAPQEQPPTAPPAPEPTLAPVQSYAQPDDTRWNGFTVPIGGNNCPGNMTASHAVTTGSMVTIAVRANNAEYYRFDRSVQDPAPELIVAGTDGVSCAFWVRIHPDGTYKPPIEFQWTGLN